MASKQRSASKAHYEALAAIGAKGPLPREELGLVGRSRQAVRP
jgi:hypothetical protein